jgi:hypothetical protein
LGESWWYGASRIGFSGGRISEYDISPMSPLKLRSSIAVGSDSKENANEATVSGFMAALMGALDKIADDVCACKTLACAKNVAATSQDRGVQAGYAYTKGKQVTNELSAFLSVNLANHGEYLTQYIKDTYPDWFASFKSRIEGCANRLN